MEILRVENLTKIYGKGENQVVALNNVGVDRASSRKSLHRWKRYL